jgi:plasmid stability protein
MTSLIAPSHTEESPSSSRTVRLSVNLPTAVADALKLLAARHGVTITEEVRRTISIAKFLDDEIVAGGAVLVERKAGGVRELILPH